MTGIPSPDEIAALRFLSDTINAPGSPPPIAEPILVDEDGMVTVPVPNYGAPLVTDPSSGRPAREVTYVSCHLHAGMTLQWAPMPEAGGVLLDLRGGAPDGVLARDAVAVFLTRRGLRGLIADLTAIDAEWREHDRVGS